MMKTSLSVALAAIVLGLLPAPAWSEGALAVGSTGNVTKDGIAFGTAVNYGSSEAARSAAMEKCRGYQSAPKAAAQCRVVGTFRRECWAIAMDPKPGTPGAGWAVASDKPTAQQRALDACRTTAGAGRTEFCEADSADCDEND
jgi:Domain of unknown function (DUF4189)